MSALNISRLPWKADLVSLAMSNTEMPCGTSSARYRRVNSRARNPIRSRSGRWKATAVSAGGSPDTITLASGATSARPSTRSRSWRLASRRVVPWVTSLVPTQTSTMSGSRPSTWGSCLLTTSASREPETPRACRLTRYWSLSALATP